MSASWLAGRVCFGGERAWRNYSLGMLYCLVTRLLTILLKLTDNKRGRVDYVEWNLTMTLGPIVTGNFLPN